MKKSDLSYFCKGNEYDLIAALQSRINELVFEKVITSDLLGVCLN